MPISETVSALITKIEKLDHDFNMYFTAQEKKAPLQALENMKKEVAILMKNATMSQNLVEQNLATQLVNRFTTYRQKWERCVRDIEEGRAKPGCKFFGCAGSSDLNDLKSAADSLERRDAEAFAMSAMIDQTAHIFIELSRKHTNKAYSFDAVAEMLTKKIGDVREKFGDNFSFDVYYEDGKVKIKPVRR